MNSEEKELLQIIANAREKIDELEEFEFKFWLTFHVAIAWLIVASFFLFINNY